VACAAAWSSAHERRLQEGSISGWDASLVALGGNESFDWTFTTPYAGSVSPEQPWRAVDERIDRSLLVARDPILFYNELTLYESELDDNGTMSLTVKVRVMPACWFVLLRYWLRVDGVLVRHELWPFPPATRLLTRRAGCARRASSAQPPMLRPRLAAPPCCVSARSVRRRLTASELGAPLWRHRYCAQLTRAAGARQRRWRSTPMQRLLRRCSSLQVAPSQSPTSA
jgi:hypothetical protein